MTKVEFRCIGENHFVKGTSCYKGIHSYEDTTDKINPYKLDPVINLGLCEECRLKVADIWFKSIVPERLQDLSFESFIQERNAKAYKFATNLKPGNGESVVFWSDGYGTGKTHLSISILKEYLNQYMLNYDMRGMEFSRHNNPASMITEVELIDKIRASYKDDGGEDESEIINKYTNVKLLLLDDIGKTTFSKDDFINRIYFLIIDRMYNKKISLIATCNGGMVKIAKQIGEACVSRLYEMCGKNIYEVAGKDYRMERK